LLLIADPDSTPNSDTLRGELFVDGGPKMANTAGSYKITGS
jgi:hypothetical protein